MLEPNLDQISAFEENLAAHNRKYHSEGFMKAGVWSSFNSYEDELSLYLPHLNGKEE